MRTKREQQQPERERDKSDPLWCQWSSAPHARCHNIAERGLPFCVYHCAATYSMARGASAPDATTRALFEAVYEHFDG